MHVFFMGFTLNWEWWFIVILSLLYRWALTTSQFEMLFSRQIIDQLINADQKLSRQLIISTNIIQLEEYVMFNMLCQTQ